MQIRSSSSPGTWGASGAVIDGLLERLLADPYFAAPAPKSTGFEHFNLDWLAPALGDQSAPADVQATLCELTAASIAAGIRLTGERVDEVLVCGGGVHNRDLIARFEIKIDAAIARVWGEAKGEGAA